METQKKSQSRLAALTRRTLEEARIERLTADVERKLRELDADEADNLIYCTSHRAEQQVRSSYAKARRNAKAAARRR